MKESSNDDKDSLVLQNQLLFKKYKIIKQIGKGTFSNVYLSINNKTNMYVAIKAEKRIPNGVELLESEAFLLYSIRGFGIPQVLSYGRTKTHNILVLPLLGKSLLDLFISKNKNIHINDICLIAIQILERIEWVHSNNIVYRDIKPENFLFGKSDPEVLYLIDFGLCRKFKSSNTGKHILPKNLGKFTGTSRYASVYAMAGNEQSRRDDIESIGYMIIFLMKKKLPWQGIKGNSYKECYHNLYLMKKYIDMEELCKDLPNEMIDYMNYAKSLKFEQQPNYTYLKDLFNLILRKNNFNFDKKIFSWVEKSSDNRDIIKYNSSRKSSNSQMNRKSSPQNRLYNKIKKSIENRNNNIKQNDKTDFTSSHKKNLNSNSKEDNLNKYKYFVSHPKKSNETSSELSNTMKVMLNKNINSGYNEKIDNFHRGNSKNNIIPNIIFSFKINDDQKKKIENHYSPQNYRFNNNYYINSQQFSFMNNNSEENSKNMINPNKHLELKRIYFIKNNNNNKNIPYTGKTIKNTPIKNNENNKFTNNNSNLKINQIKITKINNNIESNNKSINDSSLSNRKNATLIDNNITYNTYNTYNTFNSFNNTLDKTNTNNNLNNVSNNENFESNIINKRRITHIIYQKNNAKTNYLNNNKILNSKNSFNNLSDYINKQSINQKYKIIYLDKIESKRDINSVNIRQKPVDRNLNLKRNNHNKIVNNFNNRENNNTNKKWENHLRSIIGSDGKIKKNTNINILRNIIPKEMNKFNKICNDINNSFNCGNKVNKFINNNKNLNIININNNNVLDNNNSLRKGNNRNNNIVMMKNQNNLKRICITNNNNSLKNKIESNNYIRLDQMKNNLNPLKNIMRNYNKSSNNSPEKNKTDFIPKYNNYKINSLIRIPNNNKYFAKKIFPSFKYQTENDTNSALIHKNNNLRNIKINFVNENNSAFIQKEKNNLTEIDNSKNYYNNNNKYNYQDKKLISENIENEPRIVNNNKYLNPLINKNISGNMIINNIKQQKENHYSNKILKTEDIENNNLNENNENEMNKTNRINKYNMTRYKGTS